MTRKTVSSGSGSSGRQPLAELDHRGVVEPRIRVQLAQLSGGGLGDPRVRMAKHGHVVDHVEVGATGRRHQVMPPAALDLRRFGVVKLLHGAKLASRRDSRSPASRTSTAGSPSSGRGSRVSASQPGASSKRVNGGASGAPTGRTPTSTHAPAGASASGSPALTLPDAARSTPESVSSYSAPRKVGTPCDTRRPTARRAVSQMPPRR